MERILFGMQKIGKKLTHLSYKMADTKATQFLHVSAWDSLC